MTNSPTHFLNGKFVKEHEMLIPVVDLGFARGYAVFDFLVTYPTQRPFMLDKHIDRLFNSAHLIGLSLPWEKEQVRQWLMDTLHENKNADEKVLKIIVSGGTSDSLIPSGSPTIAITCNSRHTCPSEWYENGVGVITVKHNRYIPEAKSNNYIEGVKQTQAAKKIGAIEPIYYDDMQVFEGSNSNIFAVINGKLSTPKSNVIKGITRGVILETLQLTMPIEIRNLTLDELVSANEVFITGSNKEVLPVVKIDGNSVGKGGVGEVTKEVMKKFSDFTMSDKW